MSFPGNKTTDSYEVFTLMWFHHDLIHLTLQNCCSTLPPSFRKLFWRFFLFGFFSPPSRVVNLFVAKIPGLASSPNDVGDLEGFF